MPINSGFSNYTETSRSQGLFKMSWKSFKFFDLEEVKDPDTNQAYDKLKVGDESKML